MWIRKPSGLKGLSYKSQNSGLSASESAVGRCLPHVIFSSGIPRSPSSSRRNCHATLRAQPVPSRVPVARRSRMRSISPIPWVCTIYSIFAQRPRVRIARHRARQTASTNLPAAQAARLAPRHTLAPARRRFSSLRFPSIHCAIPSCSHVGARLCVFCWIKLCVNSWRRIRDNSESTPVNPCTGTRIRPSFSAPTQPGRPRDIRKSLLCIQDNADWIRRRKNSIPIRFAW